VLGARAPPPAPLCEQRLPQLRPVLVQRGPRRASTSRRSGSSARRPSRPACTLEPLAAGADAARDGDLHQDVPAGAGPPLGLRC
jgi:hypothetical protein